MKKKIITKKGGWCKMLLILIGAGSGQAVLRVPNVPRAGDWITVRQDQIVEAASGFSVLLVDREIELLGGSGTKIVKVDGEEIPWFGFQTTHHLE